MVLLDLPLPPSLNRLWRSNRGRVHRAPRYLSWLKAAGWEQRPARIDGPVRISIAAGRPDRRKRDIDNLLKAVLDLVTKHGVIQDDAQVVSLTSSWSEDVAGGRITIEVKRARARKRREAPTLAARGLDLLIANAKRAPGDRGPFLLPASAGFPVRPQNHSMPAYGSGWVNVDAKQPCLGREAGPLGMVFRCSDQRL